MFSKPINEMTRDEVIEELVKLRASRKEGIEEKRRKTANKKIDSSLSGLSESDALKLLEALKERGVI